MHYMLAKFDPNSGGITWRSKFELIQVERFHWNHIQSAKYGTNASGILFSWRDNPSYRLYTLGPLCLWQCFLTKIALLLNSTRHHWCQIHHSAWDKMHWITRWEGKVLTHVWLQIDSSTIPKPFISTLWPKEIWQFSTLRASQTLEGSKAQ